MPAANDRPRKRSERRWLLAGAAVVLVFGIAQRRWLTVNDITTGQTPEYPELQPRLYAADVSAVHSAAEAACRSLPRWRIVSQESGDFMDLHAEVRTFLFGFVDDVTIHFEPLPSSSSNGMAQTRVVIRSHSRIGRGDFGENARHIAALQSTMDARLKRSVPQH